MDVSFCERWFQPERRLINPISAEAANSKHTRREPYCAVIGGDETPTHVVSLAATWVSVSFLDERGRESLRYDFKERVLGRLFLAAAIHRAFEGATDEVIEALSSRSRKRARSLWRGETSAAMKSASGAGRAIWATTGSGTPSSASLPISAESNESFLEGLQSEQRAERPGR